MMRKFCKKSVRQALQFHHFGVDVADNGRQAVSAVYRENIIVVMDVNMRQRWNGISLRSDQNMIFRHYRLYPYCLLKRSKDRARAVKEGADNYLGKAHLFR